jgi:hypothetical protein
MGLIADGTVCSDCFGSDGVDIEVEDGNKLDPDSAIAMLQAASATKNANLV